ncbi:MAG: hypothetical protein WCB67_02985 [Solirubrobacteraceae bacterium]
MGRRLVIGMVALAIGAGCGSAGSTAPRPAVAGAPGAGLARFSISAHVQGPLDLAGPLSSGSLVLAAGGRLWTLAGAGRLALFSAAYNRPGNAEPYIAAPAPGHRGCSFGTDTVYVLRLYGGRGVVAVRRGGPVRMFARLSAPGLINGIAFDESGGFGHRLLVTINNGSHTTVGAIDCHGRVTTITRAAPRVEGGIVVARPPFGAFAGDLIAPDEKSGRIYAITPSGHSRLVVSSGLSFGQDIGVESAVQIPASLHHPVLGADRRAPGNPHPGDDALLRIDSAILQRAGVRPFDLLVGTEGGARLVDVSCRVGPCRAREIAAGPADAHLEGHLAVAGP